MKKSRLVLRWLPEILISGPRTVHTLALLGETSGRRILASMVVLRGLIFYGSLLLLAVTGGEPLPLWFILVMSFAGILWVTHPMLIARTYVHGWMDSRMDSFARLNESDTPEEWIDSMKYHDAYHLLGFKPQIPDSPEGLEE